MSESMVERVARASHEFFRPLYKLPPWEDIPDTHKSVGLQHARAVLAVIPVPIDHLGAEANETDMPPPDDPIWSDIALEVLRRLRLAGYEVVPRAPANEASAEAIRHLYAAMAGA